MRVLDLFSGIGGFALAGQWVWGNDHEIVGFCEIDKYCHKVLNKNFPGVPIYEDIRKLNGKDFKNIDLITGGFPCQDISVAKPDGKGIDGNRSGLWSEMYRVLGVVRPKFAIIENVANIINRGLERVICDLTRIGYDCEWQMLEGYQVGLPHKRRRIFIIAYPNSLRQKYNFQKKIQGFEPVPRQLYRSTQDIVGRWDLCEPLVYRSGHGIPNWVDRFIGLGNAIVPQVAYKVMKMIKECDE